MKRIYSKDIKAMKLTEDELWWAEDVFDDINKNGVENSLRYYLRAGHYEIKDKTSMLKKAFKYFAKKYLKEIEGCDQCSFWKMSCYVADVLCVSPCELQRWYRGMRCEDESIYIAETFGLDTFGIYEK
jgi:hypothetical protein|nr:MAG TPA: hypothetical protein [Caudoviricetes sp.]